MEEVLFTLGVLFFMLCVILALVLKEETKNKKFLEDEIERLIKEEKESKRKIYYEPLTNQYFFSNDEEIEKMKDRIDKNLGL